MRVLMLGWEFPPYISGGLGTACFGLTKAMSDLGVEIQFVLPRPAAAGENSHVRLLDPGRLGDAGGATGPASELAHVTIRTVDAALSPYQSGATSRRRVAGGGEAGSVPGDAGVESPTSVLFAGTAGGPGEQYAGDLFAEVERYTQLVTRIAIDERFDVIHAHDWMTFPAGAAVAALTGRPLVAHVHSTEFDRSGEHVNQRIYDIERSGVHAATRVIAVSYLTRSILTNRYGANPGRIEVVYNAIDAEGPPGGNSIPRIERDEKIVLFLGRITMQKGPEYFLAAARKVLGIMDNVRFIMAGSGDMIRRTIELAAEMGIGHKVLFTGFLVGDDVDRVFRMADLYVMPSVSEPFGIAPLEAMSRDVPVIISKQSGVSEVLRHVLKVDFWDIDEMANKIVAVLRHPPLSHTLREHGSFEVRKLRWEDSARHCLDIYHRLTAAA